MQTEEHNIEIEKQRIVFANDKHIKIAKLETTRNNQTCENWKLKLETVYYNCESGNRNWKLKLEVGMLQLRGKTKASSMCYVSLLFVDYVLRLLLVVVLFILYDIYYHRITPRQDEGEQEVIVVVVVRVSGFRVDYY